MERDQRLEEHVRHFLLQWEYFPFPALMIRRDRTVLAANPAAERVGIPDSIRCCNAGRTGSHEDCLADCATDEKAATRLTGWVKDAGMVLDSYWMPVADLHDVFIHFSIDISRYASADTFPSGADQ